MKKVEIFGDVNNQMMKNDAITQSELTLWYVMAPI